MWIIVIALQGSIIFTGRLKETFTSLPSFAQFPKSYLSRHESSLRLWQILCPLPKRTWRSLPSCRAMVSIFSPLAYSPPWEHPKVWLPTGRSIYFRTKLGHFVSWMQAVPFWLRDSYLHRLHWRANCPNSDNHLLVSPVPYRHFSLYSAKTEMTFLHYQLTHFYSLPLPYLEKRECTQVS